MLGHLVSREGDYPVLKPYAEDRRLGAKRRRSVSWQTSRERRNRRERRVDHDWRFAVIRKAMQRLSFAVKVS